jgi:hypothetical protein
VKTKQQILEAVEKEKTSQVIDRRDFYRLCKFFDADQLHLFGFDADNPVDWQPMEYTEAIVLSALQEDVQFAFHKALTKRGISSSLMYEVIKMWMWVLDDDLQHWNSYAMYGLPLYKAVALKYGFGNPIGDDKGSESFYDA